MQAKEIVRRVFDIASPIAGENGLSIWDVTYEKDGGSFVLTVHLDKEGGVSIDECEKVSRAIDPILDRHDFIRDSYMLCVASAGLTRVLSRDEHFEKSLGKKIELRFYKAIDGAKSAVGTLLSFDKDNVVIEMPNAGEKAYSRADIAHACLYFDF